MNQTTKGKGTVEQKPGQEQGALGMGSSLRQTASLGPEGPRRPGSGATLVLALPEGSLPFPSWIQEGDWHSPET